jgi:hypothetical protein
MRFAVKERMSKEIPLPPSIKVGSDEERLWDETLDTIQEAYDVLINRGGIPAEDARGLLPHAVTTRVHYKTNLRNLVDHAGNRLCTQAQFEWRGVFTEIVNAIRYYAPPVKLNEITALPDGLSQAWMFERIARSNLFRPKCFQLGHCPFNADFDRGCTIRPRVEEGKFDQIQPAEWLLDPKAARR